VNIQEIKDLGLYDLPQSIVNEQSKKYMNYDQFVDKFLREEPKDVSSYAEKKALFLMLWGTMFDKKMEQDLNYMKSMKVLDVRTKDGRLPEMLTTKEMCSYAVGVDMVKEWTDYAISKGRQVIHAPDLTNLPFTDNSFDIVYSYRTFGRVKDNRDFLKELIRVSKKYVFLLVDDITKDRNMQFATTLDLRNYKKWINEADSVELTLATNPVSGNANEKLVAIFKRECTSCNK